MPRRIHLENLPHWDFDWRVRHRQDWLADFRIGERFVGIKERRDENRRNNIETTRKRTPTAVPQSHHVRRRASKDGVKHIIKIAVATIVDRESDELLTEPGSESLCRQPVGVFPKIARNKRQRKGENRHDHNVGNRVESNLQRP